MVMKLTDTERDITLKTLHGWQLARDGSAIEKDFLFPNFKVAWAFMQAVAKLADVQDHHPEWSNVYNKVHILLTTHDVDGLSERDIKLASAIDQIL